MLERFAELGYANADPELDPHDSDKHGFFKLEKRGRFYFAKYSKDDASRQNSISTDIWWCQTVQKIRATHQLSIRTPEIIEYGDDWYIAQWIEGHPSMEPADPLSTLDQNLHSYAHCLVALDSVESRWLESPSPVKEDPESYDRLGHLLAQWSEKPIAKGLMTTESFEQARLVIHDYQKYLTPHFQHGDFVPWHILVDANQDQWLIDGEHASVQKPHYYDLAFMSSRIFTRLHSPKHSASLLNTFMQESDTPAEMLYPALLPIMTARAIGMHFDALNDLHHDDYRFEAQDLLERCISRDPARLFSAG